MPDELPILAARLRAMHRDSSRRQREEGEAPNAARQRRPGEDPDDHARSDDAPGGRGEDPSPPERDPQG